MCDQIEHMDSKDIEFLTMICKRPRMMYASASTFRDVLAFVCGVRVSTDRPHGDFGDFPQFVVAKLGASPSIPWTESVLEAFGGLDMDEGCAKLEELLQEYRESEGVNSL